MAPSALDEQRGRAGRLPDGVGFGFGVRVEHAAHAETEQCARAEQQCDREHLRASRRDVQADDADEAADEAGDRAEADDVPAEVGAECEERERDRDQAHHLAEDAGRADRLDRAEHPFVFVCRGLGHWLAPVRVVVAATGFCGRGNQILGRGRNRFALSRASVARRDLAGSWIACTVRL